MIINDKIHIDEYDPCIKTEETIFDLLIRDKDLISDEYELMVYPLAHWINTIGIPNTQKIISENISDKKRIFICQHIYVNKLKFNETDIIFTPHAYMNDNYISIPHYAVNIDRLTITDNRRNLFSFIGSISTHITRKVLVQNYPNNCFDSKVHWGLELNLSQDFRNKYINLLSDTIFSICPRGTGISSVRLFESMAMGCIPIIIGDNYEPPLSDIIDWNEISITIPEDGILNDDGYLIPNIISDYIKQNDIKQVSNKVLEVYNTYLSNDKLHKTILKEL